MSIPPLHPPSFTSTTITPQSTSPFFATLPPELRHAIYTYVLTPYPNPDPARSYKKETYYHRPGHTAPHITSTSLLLTCKQVYAETWFLPFALAEHIIYLTAQDRAPARGPTTILGSSSNSRSGFATAGRRGVREEHPRPHQQGPGHPWRFGRDLAESLELISTVHGEIVETGNLHVFAQLYILEPGAAFQRVLDTPFLRPRSVTLTIRYTDFWHWEDTRPLWINGKWVKTVVFPESVRVFRVEFEMILRREEEVQILVEQAAEKWVFRRDDGKTLTARPDDADRMQWRGSSTLNGKRWVRDEIRPGQLDYVVYSVPWRVDSFSCAALDSPSWSETEEGNEDDSPTIRVPESFIQPPPPLPGWTSLSTTELERAGVGPDVRASEAVDGVQAYRRQHAADSMRARMRRVMAREA
ncbi:hypothetical protein BJY04DRAFT_196343 [Aspergillus karnatakaensis]|uniref:uncharacterized protein n=1 Tax=Aspergillus karnatakaensis TaxID=1810916 RepID=UPI003CCD31CF